MTAQPYMGGMTDILSPERRSRLMGRIRGKNTLPEMIVRRLAYKLGYRYRLHSSKLPGKPDLVFAGRRKVIFVHGCFWHRHENCKKAGMPKSREEFWKEKFDRNVERDERVRHELEEGGWQVLTIWQCELKNALELENKLRNFLR